MKRLETGFVASSWHCFDEQQGGNEIRQKICKSRAGFVCNFLISSRLVNRRNARFYPVFNENVRGIGPWPQDWSSSSSLPHKFRKRLSHFVLISWFVYTKSLALASRKRWALRNDIQSLSASTNELSNAELFTRLCGGGALFNHSEGILRGWNGDKPWIIIYKYTLAEVIKYW